MSDLSWLNPTPHAIAVYASQPLSPVATQHSLPSGRYSLTWAGLPPAGSHQLAAGALIRSPRRRAHSVGGSLSAGAVLRLILSWYLIGAWTGRSAGFSRLRISLTTASGAFEAIGYKVPGLRHGQQVGPSAFR